VGYRRRGLLLQQGVHGADELDQILDGHLPVLVGDARERPQRLEMVHAGVLRLLQPVALEDVPGEWIERLVVLEGRQVVELREPFDGGGEQQNRARLLAQHSPGHVFLAGKQREREAHGVVNAAANLAEEVHVLDSLGREVREGVERLPMADLEVTGQRDHLRRDEQLLAVGGYHIFNGDGTGKDVVSASINGVSVENNAGNHPDRSEYGISYTVNPDCSGTYTVLPAGPSFGIFVAPDGQELLVIETTPGFVLAQGPSRRVSRK